MGSLVDQREGVRKFQVFLRMFKKTFKQDRSERKPKAYSVGYVEGLSEVRTMLEGFFNSR